MILKIFKAVWFLSLMGFMAIFMYIYASLPVEVLIRGGENAIVTSRDLVFYASIAVIALVNVLVFVMIRLSRDQSDVFNCWFLGQIILLNFFFCTVLGFINVLNSGEKFQFERLGIVIYGSVVLIVVWAISWPIYSISTKYLRKLRV